MIMIINFDALPFLFSVLQVVNERGNSIFFPFRGKSSNIFIQGNVEKDGFKDDLIDKKKCKKQMSIYFSVL